jgi:hypothetical protein
MRTQLKPLRATHSIVVTLALLGGTEIGMCAADDVPAPTRAVGSTSAPLLTLIAETRDFDQLAVEGAWHLGRGRFSLFAGIGYLPRDAQDERLPGIALFTGGARLHTRWFRRRGYAELGWGPLARALRISPGHPPEQFLANGPSVLLGYQRVARTGLTFLAAAGYGYARSSDLDGAVHNPELRLGLGYTWRSRSAALR